MSEFIYLDEEQTKRLVEAMRRELRSYKSRLKRLTKIMQIANHHMRVFERLYNAPTVEQRLLNHKKRRRR